MIKKRTIILLSMLILSGSILTAYGDKEDVGKAPADKVDGKWYASDQVSLGKKVFEANCAVCHGDTGQGLVADWQKQGKDGRFPAPPLNGTAHTWHHSKALLLRTVNEGGVAIGGAMPPFKNKLTDEEKVAVLAYVMNLWPSKIYEVWQKRNPVTK